MEYVILFVVLIWLFGRSIKKKDKALKEERLAFEQRFGTGAARNEDGGLATADNLNFVDLGKEPKVDVAGRVVVQVASGKDLQIGFNLKYLDEAIAKKIAGKRTDDDEFSKRVKVRIFLDTNSAYADSFRVETKSGEFLGWTLKADSALLVILFQQLESAVKPLDSRLKDAVFALEVSATFAGSWNDDVDEADDGQEFEIECVEIEEAYIRIGDPAKLQVG